MYLKKIFAVLVSLYGCTLSAQILSVSAGTNLKINSGTLLYLDRMILTPSIDYTVSNTLLNRDAVITSSNLSSPYIARVYHFSTNQPPYTGDIQINYDPSELNSLAEPSLTLHIFDGTSYSRYATGVTSDVVAHTLLTTGLNNVVLRELTLASTSSTLPLHWGTIQAYRKNKMVDVNWSTLMESNVSHFEVERSFDGLSWRKIASDIPASNRYNGNKYLITDNEYYPNIIFYRVKQVGITGDLSYSPVVSVAAEHDKNTLYLFPNPASNTFKIYGIDISIAIVSVSLYNDNGQLLKIWNGSQLNYRINNQVPGIYKVRVSLHNGTTHTLTLIKQ